MLKSQIQDLGNLGRKSTVNHLAVSMCGNVLRVIQASDNRFGMAKARLWVQVGLEALQPRIVGEKIAWRRDEMCGRRHANRHRVPPFVWIIARDFGIFSQGPDVMDSARSEDLVNGEKLLAAIVPLCFVQLP